MAYGQTAPSCDPLTKLQYKRLEEHELQMQARDW